MAFWDKFNKHSQVESTTDNENIENLVSNELPPIDNQKLFQTGNQFPPQEDVERLAKYKRGKRIFDGKTYDAQPRGVTRLQQLRHNYYEPTHLFEVYDRAEKLLANTPFQSQLHHLYIAVNIIDILIVKIADLMVGEAPTFDATTGDGSVEQERLNSIVEENDIVQLVHEQIIGGGYKGDGWFKNYYSYRQDFSALPSGVQIPKNVVPEPIIENVNAENVYPELSRGSSKKFRAVNIAYVEWVMERGTEVPYLDVERHVPGAIIYERYRVYPNGVDSQYGVPIEIFKIGEKVPTGRKTDLVETGVPHMLIHHVPHKSVDDRWEGISSIEKLESVLAAINDRISQIDFILWKHADPSVIGPPLEGENVSFGGKYFEVDKDDVEPKYMVWDAQLEGAFKELELLLGTVFQMSETPQFVFGTSLAGNGNAAGGTSHTTSDAIKIRFFPLISKVKRVRMSVDKALRMALWTAQILENYANEGIDGFESYEPQYPKIQWKDGLPRDMKTLAEVANVRTGGKANQSVLQAIMELDEVGEVRAKELLDEIQQDEQLDSFVDPSALRPPLKPTQKGE